jgi:hypothetical protein
MNWEHYGAIKMKISWVELNFIIFVFEIVNILKSDIQTQDLLEYKLIRHT